MKNKLLPLLLIILVGLFNLIVITLLLNDITLSSFLIEKQKEGITQKFLPKVPKTIKIPSSLKLIKTERFETGRGVKSVIFGKEGQYLYSLNLESMSIFEFERKSRTISRKLKFKATKGKGYNYTTKKWYDSYQEKPVEPCITHQGKYLWASLHNGGGVVAWNIQKTEVLDSLYKIANITDSTGNTHQTHLRFIATGKTPKGMAVSPDGKYLFVSNWHSNTLSVINITSDHPMDWTVIKTIPTGAVPRGVLVSLDSKKVFVGHMASNTMSVIDVDSLKVIREVKIGRTPRHFIQDQNKLYATLSSPEKLLKIDTKTYQIDTLVSTKDDPRTIAFSPDHQLIFTTCYADELLQVFDTKTLTEFGTWPSKGKPVGVATYQQGNLIEAWVCNYTYATIKVFSFELVYKELIEE